MEKTTNWKQETGDLNLSKLHQDVYSIVRRYYCMIEIESANP